jgi:ATP-dependent Clp protease, protease subunit
MKAGMVAAYRDKSGRDDAEIEALMAAETWLSAKEALELGLADRIEQPVRMAAHFDLSRFRNTPPQLAALAVTPSPQEDDMSDAQKTRPRKPDAVEATAAGDAAPKASTEQLAPAEETGEPKLPRRLRPLPSPRRPPPAPPAQQPPRTSRRRRPLQRRPPRPPK